MSSAITFRRAIRESVPLLIAVAGSSGSGKTYSLLELAKGLTPAGKRFAFIDTEAGRGLAYADQFDFDYTELRPDFTPERYLEVIKAADKAGYPVIVIDSFSHEYAGSGGLMDWHDAELDRMAGDDWKKRAAMGVPAWSKPKQAHKAMMAELLQVRAHLLFGLRAEEKIAMEKDSQGRTEIVPKSGPGGFKGWLPICEKNFPYELTCSFLLMADAPGVPKPIKLQAQHLPFFPEGKRITESAGRQLAEWARGGTSQPEAQRGSVPAPADRAPSDTAGQGPDSGEGASQSRAPEPRGESGPGPTFDAFAFSEMLKAATLTVSDLSPQIGPVTRDNWQLAVTAWLIANPDKGIRDLIAEAVPPAPSDAEQEPVPMRGRKL